MVFRNLIFQTEVIEPTPMKHSNKDGTLSAESAEGRLRLKENALPPDTYPTQSGTARVSRVDECAVRRCLAALYPREEPDPLPRNSHAPEAVFMQPWVRSGQVRSLVVWLAA